MKEKRDLILYRLSRAHETLEEADILLQVGHGNAFVNRLYYACFYVVSALLLSKGFSSAKHTGVRALFNRNFVNRGLVSSELGKFYDMLFRNRQRGDYADMVHYEPDEVRGWYASAEEFIRVNEELTFKELQRENDESSGVD